MKTMLRFSMVLMLLMVVGYAQVINNFDVAPADTNYWEWYAPVTEGGSEENPAAHYAISTNADPTLGWIETSFVTDMVLEGEGAMRIDYSAQNAESWGGYVKLQHFHPDTLSTETYDWSLYDSISFSYYNLTPQSALGTVHLRLNLSDYGSVTDSAYRDLGEFFYSFNYILDDEPGWSTLAIPLISNGAWGTGEGFNLTGWSGDAGNEILDLDRIKAFGLEFSISGGGEGNVTTGSIILDDMKLTGPLNLQNNAGFELADGQEDDFGWGVAMADGAHAMMTTDVEVARTGEKFAEIGTSGSQWSVMYTEDFVAAAFGETFEVGGYIKDISAIIDEGNFGGFKIEAKNDSGDVIGTTGDQMFPVTEGWQKFTYQLVMPPETATMALVLVASRWDGSACNYAFDDFYIVNLGNLDSEAPVMVTGINSVLGTNYNLISWIDNVGELVETYTVYGSRYPITDLTSLNVDVVASGVLEGVQAASHRLYAPLNDESQTWYYAVSCTDASLNVGPAGDLGVAVINDALGVPTISLGAPANFAADGDVSEWDDAGIVPFEMSNVSNSYGTPHFVGVVDDAADLMATVWLAVDDEYLYVAADVIDNVYLGYISGTGSWWEYDVFELFIGLYNQRGPVHTSFGRGEQPDYKFYFHDTGYNRDVPENYAMGADGDGMYFMDGINPNYALEAKISLDSIATANGNSDAVFVPENGMRIAFEPTFHDRDVDTGWDGNVVLSPTNDDNAHQTPSVWSHTYIGDLDAVSVNKSEVPMSYMLGNNYPNPFNPSTTINYALGQAGEVRLTIYNVLGQEVQTLVNEVQTVGSHQIHFDASALASGVYLYRLETAGFTATNKMILMK